MATDDDKVLVSREYLNDVLEGATDEVGNALRAALDDAPEATNLTLSAGAIASMSIRGSGGRPLLVIRPDGTWEASSEADAQEAARVFITEATNLIQMAKRSAWEEGFSQGASWGMRYMGDEPNVDRPRNPHEESSEFTITVTGLTFECSCGVKAFAGEASVKAHAWSHDPPAYVEVSPEAPLFGPRSGSAPRPKPE